MTVEPHAEWRPRHSPWLVAFSVLLATFMEVLDTSVANVSLSHIAGSLSASIDEATWVLTSYLVANAIILPMAGWLSAFFGRKRYLAFSVVVFVLASAACGAAQTLPQLIIARVIQGLGGGGLQPLAQAVLLESFPKERRGVAMAMYGLGIVFAPIIGPTLGGWLTDSYSWRWIFFINIPIGAVGLLLQQLFLEDPPYIKAGRAKKIDFFGFALIIVGIGLLQIVLDKGQEEDWFSSTWICWSLGISLVSLAVLVFWELQVREPLINLRLLKNLNFSLGICLITVLGAILYGTIALLPIYMQNLLDYPALATGIAMSPRGVGAFLGTFLIGRMIAKSDPRRFLALGFGIVAVTCWMFTHLSLETSQEQIIVPLILNGVGMSFIFAPLATVSVATLRQEELWQATGMYNLVRNIGGSLGISLLVTYLARNSQTNQSRLTSQLTPYSLNYQEWLHRAEHFLPPGTSLRVLEGRIYHALVDQAYLIAFNNSFRWLAIGALLCVPLAFFFAHPHRKKG
ncbi:MAG: DHA2 family efflux MFS transporter permease subunit [Pseudomonadota bacterium]